MENRRKASRTYRSYSQAHLNGYAAGYSARAFGELLRGVLPTGEVVFGDVGIQEMGSERVLPTGIYALWEPK